MKRLVIIKLGGGLITDLDTPFTLRFDVLEALAAEIQKGVFETPDTHFVVVHGGGSFAGPIKHYGLKEGIKADTQRFGYSVAHDALQKLNGSVVDTLLRSGVPVVSVGASQLFTTEHGEIAEADLEYVGQLLSLNIVPCIFSDVVFDNVLGSGVVRAHDILPPLLEFAQDRYDVMKVILVKRADRPSLELSEKLKELGAEVVDSRAPDGQGIAKLFG